MMTTTSATFVQVDSGLEPENRSDHLYQRPCPVCSSDLHRPVFGLEDFQYFTDDTSCDKRANIRHVICKRCYCLYMNPTYTPEGFAILFEEAGQSYGASMIRDSEQLEWLKSRGLLRAGLSFLDVGCYLGKFIAGLPAEVTAVGVDIDQTAVAEAQARHGGPGRRFVAADFEQLEMEAQPDVITMFHVLEHLPRPVLVLKKLRALAQAETRLVLEVPVLELAKTNDINGYLTVSHLTHFSKASLAKAMNSAGWQIIDETLQDDYNGYRVLAIPAQVGQAPADPRDLGLLYDYLAFFYQALQEAERVLAQIPTVGRWLVWGGGFHTELIYQLFSFFQAQQARFLIVDMDPKKQGKSWRGIPIHHPDVLSEIDLPGVQLLISSYGNQEDIATAALAHGLPESNLHRLYAYIRRY